MMPKIRRRLLARLSIYLHLLALFLEIIKSQLGLFFIILTFLFMCDINNASFARSSSSGQVAL